MENSSNVMNRFVNNKNVSLIVTITKRNIVHPAIYRLKKWDIHRVDLESIHIRDFPSTGISNVFKVAEISRVK